MKKKLKQISKVLLLCSMLYFTSCINDDFIVEQNLQNPKNYQLKKISFKELKNNKKAFEKLKESRLKKNQSLQYRGVYNEDYGVFIDTTNIILVENGDKHSLTFQIVNEDQNNTKVENLVLNSKDDGGYLAFITEYNLTQQDLIKINNGETLTTKTPTSITEIENLARLNVDGDGSDCIDLTIHTVSMCRNSSGNTIYNNGELGNDCVGMPFEVEYMIMTIDAGCLSDGGGDSSSGGGDNNGGNYSDPGNTSGQGNPILTTPILESDPNEKKLKKISNNTYIKAKINELKTKCTNPNQLTEDGAQYIKTGSGYSERLPYATFPDETRFDPSFVPNVEVVIHMHELQTYIIDPTGQNPPELVNIVPVFSDGDIYAFLGLAEYTNYANDNITAIVVTPAGTFAMRLDDASKMEQALALLEPIGEDTNGNPINSPDMNKFKKEYETKVIDACGDTDNACFTAAFTTFINTFTLSNGQTLGISYYQASFDANNNITNWTKQQ